MLSRLRNALLLTVACSWLVGCSSLPRAEPSKCALGAVDTAGWRVYDEAAFTVSLPPEYEAGALGGLDSQGRTWRSGAKVVSYDFGNFSNRLTPGDGEFPDLVVCQRGASKQNPRIIMYSEGAGHGVGAHWAQVSGEPRYAESLTLVGTVPDPMDRAEILAIIRSVRFK